MSDNNQRIPVSYTHLDVYKRQIQRWREYRKGMHDAWLKVES